MTKVTVALSRKVSDGAYGSFQANIGLEDDVPPGVSKDSHAAGMRAWCKAFLDETLGDMKDAYMALDNFESASEEFAEEVGAEVTNADVAQDNREKGFKDVHVEEKPPLPGKIVPNESGADTDFRIESEPVATVVRTPLTDNQATFRVRYFEVATSGSRQKYLKCFGKGKWGREWVPAWNDKAKELSGFDGLDDMDDGEVQVPFPLEATVEMGEYKGKPSPNKVVEWTRVG